MQRKRPRTDLRRGGDGSIAVNNGGGHRRRSTEWFPGSELQTASGISEQRQWSEGLCRAAATVQIQRPPATTGVMVALDTRSGSDGDYVWSRRWSKVSGGDRPTRADLKSRELVTRPRGGRRDTTTARTRRRSRSRSRQLGFLDGGYCWTRQWRGVLEAWQPDLVESGFGHGGIRGCDRSSRSGRSGWRRRSARWI